jgi:hypothetical protein
MEASSERLTTDNRSTSSTILSIGNRGHGYMWETPRPTSHLAGCFASSLSAKGRCRDDHLSLDLILSNFLNTILHPAFIRSVFVAAFVVGMFELGAVTSAEKVNCGPGSANNSYSHGFAIDD